MAEKKTPKGVQKLKADLAAGRLAPLYLFYGEESYLKEYYRSAVVKRAAGGGFDDFNIVELSERQVTPETLTEAVEGLPFGADKKVVIVRDYPLMRASGAMKDTLTALLDNLPDTVCLIFYFDAQEFKPDKRLSLWKLLEKKGEIVEFERAGMADLAPWIRRRFEALGKTIGRAECEYLVFLCGALMTNLITEIEKIAAGTPKKAIGRDDIDRLASRTLEAQVFDLTDCMMEGKHRESIGLLRDLFAAKNSPIAVLAAVTKQMQRLYAARLVLESRGGEGDVMRLCALRSPYPARLLLRACARMELPFLRRAARLCLEADLGIKSNLPDDERTVELLLLRLAAAREECA